MPKSVREREPARGFETEIKFSVSPENIELVKASHFFAGVSAWQYKKLVSVYFDTADLALRRSGISCRVRRQPDHEHLMGVKLAPAEKNAFRRVEVEVAVAADRPELDKLPPAVARKINARIAGQPLLDQFEIAVDRQTCMLRHLNSDIEVALDQGFILAAGRQVPLSEVELELKSGHVADLYDLGLQMAGHLPLTLKFTSKAQTGYQIVAPVPIAGFKAAALKIPQNVTVPELVAMILASALSQITMNWHAAEHVGNPEPLHQLRVGLRRLRSALGLFSRHFPLQVFADLKDRANAAMAHLSAARDFDVAVTAVGAAEFRLEMSAVSHNELLVFLENRRIEAYSRANVALRGSECSELILGLCLHLAQPPQQEAGKARAGKTRRQLVSSLGRMHRKALKQGQHIARAAPHELHKLRIALKNLRYGCEFLAPLLGSAKKEAAFSRSLQEVLALLGHRNDGAAMNGMMLEIPLSAQPELHEAAGFVLGWNAHEALQARAKLVEVWHKFRRTKAPWV